MLLGDESIQSSKDVLVDADESFLTIKMKRDGLFRTAMEISLYDKIKPAETIWYGPPSSKNPRFLNALIWS